MTVEEKILEKISVLTEITIILYREGTYVWGKGSLANNPIIEQEELRQMLVGKADSQQVPVIYQDKHQVVFAAVKQANMYYFFGPISLARKNKIELHQYYKAYEINIEEEASLPTWDFTKIFTFVEAVAMILFEKDYTDAELIVANQLNVAKDVPAYTVNYEEEYSHHTYREEMELLKCVAEGDVDGAVKQAVIMDAKIGKLSQNEMLHWKKAIVAEITLCTRTAIEGGVVPAEAYQISDYFIEKSDECKDIAAIIVCRNIAIKELTERVLKIRRAGKKSPYIEQCIEYIEKNYRRKISISNMAEGVGLNNSYLSRLFKKEMGMSIQEYIIRVRLEKAAYQLVYSDASITEIAAHVNFATPSYFGKIFHKYNGMTPTEYRKKYKI